MSQINEEFASLLSEAIHTVKSLESKSINVIQDELGFALGRDGGSPIIHWRRGYIPEKRLELEMLARELVRRGQGKLDRMWLEKLLRCANFPSEALSEELFPIDDSHTDHLYNRSLPGRDYGQLAGREKIINDIISLLQMPDGFPIIAICGQGGIGKTAVLLEASYRCIDQNSFDSVIWMSASHLSFSGVELLGNYMTFEAILDVIGSTLAESDFSKQVLIEKKQRVKMMLANRRVLIVLDNMETAIEPQNNIVEQLAPLLGFSRVLLTSRHHFRGELHQISLTGLDQTESLALIKQIGLSHDIKKVQMASSNELQSITETIGGSPLAIKLVVGQLNLFDIEIVLKYLREVTPLKGLRSGGEYLHFYKFIFNRSWRLLKKKDKQILLCMAKFNTDEGSHLAALQYITRFEMEILVSCIENLWEFSFLEVRPMASLQTRYCLHPLTQYFILSDIAKLHFPLKP